MTKLALTPHHISLYAQYAIINILLNHSTKGLPVDDPDEFGWVMSHELANQEDVLSMGYQKPLPNTIKKTLKTLSLTINTLPHHPDEAFDQSYQNLNHLTNLLKLGHAEHEILRFMIHARLENPLKQTLNAVKVSTLRDCHAVIASVTGLPIGQVRQVCHQNHLLVKLKVLEITQYRGFDRFFEFIDLGDAIELDQLTDQTLDDGWLKHATYDSPPPKLNLSDFDYLDQKLDLLTDYLQHTKSTKKIGVNILIYGTAGTGKTQLATLLAQKAGYTPRTIATQNKHDEVISVDLRLSGYYIANLIYKDRQDTLLIFDEIDHIFNDDTMFEKSFATQHKAWINELLENNHCPSIWIGNHIDHMDKAFIRRFDIVLHMPNMPFQKKREFITALSPKPLRDDYLDCFCQNTHLTPAIIERGLNVATAIYTDAEVVGRTAFALFNETLMAQGHEAMPKIQSQKTYNLAWINTTQNLQQITDNLSKQKQARICCYGPAGTGKTQWAHHLAKQAGMPALTVKASDLLGRFVGETEQNIARFFRQAQELQMALIIDEVDSFLFDRNHAGQSWEQTMVNEMLTQIENFDGLLIVSTNVMYDLDKAVLRRFDLKIEFRHLNQHQLKDIAHYYAEQLNLSMDDHALQSLMTLHHLGMGDFVSVFRQHRFNPFTSIKAFIEALAQENQLKQGRQQRIGF